MRVFVTGVGGQLGHDVVNNLIARGHEAVGSDIQEKDIWGQSPDKELTN